MGKSDVGAGWNALQAYLSACAWPRVRRAGLVHDRAERVIGDASGPFLIFGRRVGPKNGGPDFVNGFFPCPPAVMPGDALLFQRLSVSTIGAVRFHGRVRDGIGWVTDAMATKQWSRRDC